MLRKGLRDSVTVVSAGVSCSLWVPNFVQSKLQCFKKLFIYLLVFGFTGSSLLCVGFLQSPCAGFSVQ